jgi:hypothetical protein
MHSQLRQRTSGVGAINTSDSVGHSRRSRSPSPYQDDEQADLINENEVANLPPEVAQLLKRKGLEERLSSKQKKWHEMKVGCAVHPCMCCSAADARQQAYVNAQSCIPL